ncbi:MAG TPA: DUF4434 domain-containing protein [Thermoanaerobaculia bacterium]|jgi:hypothetical protein
MRQFILVLALIATTARAAETCVCPLPAGACDVAAEAPAAVLKDSPACISGVFVDLTEYDKWGDPVQKLADAGITKIIVQSAKFDYQKAKDVLAAAETRNVKVYIGLNYDGHFDAGTSSLADALKADRLILKEIGGWKADERKMIDGWYIAHEIHNFQIWSPELNDKPAERLKRTWARARKLQQYLKTLTGELKKVEDVKENVPILISPTFNPKRDGALLSPKHTETLFRLMFQDSGVDFVLLQDSIGARNRCERIGGCRWSRPEFVDQAYMYERAVQKGLACTKTKFGVNVESFEFNAKYCTTRAATPAEFAVQRRLVPEDAAMVVTFSLATLFDEPLWNDYVKSGCAAKHGAAATGAD